MRALINDNNSLYVVDESPVAETRYRARFYFNPNSLTMANNDAHYIFYGLTSANVVALRLELGYATTTGYRIRAAVRNNSGTYITSSWVTLSNAWHSIEIDRVSASSGSLTMWIDGVQRASLTGVSSNTLTIERVRLGVVTGVDSGTRGTEYFDNFVSNRLSYIGQ
jgi:hypothetical protein